MSPLTDTELREANALRTLTVALAKSLSDVGLRQRLNADMQHIGVTHELKLSLDRYLKGNSGGIFLAKMEQRSGISRDSLSALLAIVRPQEMYLPVRTQRAAWRGEDVIVASQLREHAPIDAFRTDGTPVTLDEQSAPTEPTIVVVGAETNFSQAPYSSQATRQPIGPALLRAAPGAATFSVDPCPGGICDGGGGGGDPVPVVPASAPSGVYMTYSSMYDLKEPWVRGDPEVEVHAVGPNPNDPKDTSRDMSCAAAGEPDYRGFDQNNNTWNGYVLVISDQVLAENHYQVPSDGRSFNVIMYEDDDQHCVIQDDPYRVVSQTAQIAGWGGVGYFMIQNCHPGIECELGTLGILYEWGAALWSIFQTNDDYLGMAILKAQVPGFTDGWANHAMLLTSSQSSINGGITLKYHTYGVNTY